MIFLLPTNPPRSPPNGVIGIPVIKGMAATHDACSSFRYMSIFFVLFGSKIESFFCNWGKATVVNPIKPPKVNQTKLTITAPAIYYVQIKNRKIKFVAFHLGR